MIATEPVLENPDHLQWCIDEELADIFKYCERKDASRAAPSQKAHDSELAMLAFLLLVKKVDFHFEES